MPYARKRGKQIAIVNGERDPKTGKVQQQILFTIYSKAEALKIIGHRDENSAYRFRSLIEYAYPNVRFDWKKINEAIKAELDFLPDLYQYKTARLQSRFRKDLSALTRQLILTDPQELMSAAQLIQENQHELEYLSDLINWRLALREQEADEWNEDNQFYWRMTLRGDRVPPEAEEHAIGYYNRGEYDRAEAIFNLLTECFKGYAEGYNYLGLIALEREKFEKAISYFEECMVLGRNLFPKKLARKHYWMNHSTRPYMRGMMNMTHALNRLGRYDEALSLCDRLEGECGDKFSAASYRATIYLNVGYWQSAAKAARYLHRIYPSHALISAFAHFELGRYDVLLPYFLYGTLNYPRASRMINDQRINKPKSSEEFRDHKEGVLLCRSLHDFKKNQSRKSKRFFKYLLNQPNIKALIHESEDLADRWHNQRPTPEKAVFNRMKLIHSIEFAQEESVKLESALEKILSGLAG